MPRKEKCKEYEWETDKAIINLIKEWYYKKQKNISW